MENGINRKIQPNSQIHSGQRSQENSPSKKTRMQAKPRIVVTREAKQHQRFVYLVAALMLIISALIYQMMSQGRINDQNQGMGQHHHHHNTTQSVFSSSVTYFLLAALAVIGIVVGKDYYETKTRDFALNSQINQLTEEEYNNQTEAYTLKEVNNLMKSSQFKQFQAYKQKQNEISAANRSRESSPRKGVQVQFVPNDEEEDALEKEFVRIDSELSQEPKFSMTAKKERASSRRLQTPQTQDTSSKRNNEDD